MSDPEKPIQEKPYMTPQQVAERFMVSPITVRSWVTRGWLQAELTAGGHRRFLVSAVDAFARSRELANKRPLNNTEQAAPRILIVDDDAQIAHYLNELITNAEQMVLVETACDGFDAGFKVRQFNPDVVLLDLMMPGMNGFETCRRIKREAETSAIRVIAMSGFPSTENRQQILDAGAEHCLAKPLDESALLDLLGLTLAMQHPASEMSADRNIAMS